MGHFLPDLGKISYKNLHITLLPLCEFHETGDGKAVLLYLETVWQSTVQRVQYNTEYTISSLV